MTWSTVGSNGFFRLAVFVASQQSAPDPQHMVAPIVDTPNPLSRLLWGSCVFRRHLRVSLAHHFSLSRSALDAEKMGVRSSTMRWASPHSTSSAPAVSASTWEVDGCMKPCCRQGYAGGLWDPLLCRARTVHETRGGAACTVGTFW